MTQFEYFCQLSPPSLAEPVAQWLDQQLEAAVGFTVSQVAAGSPVTCPVYNLQGHSYQEWLIRMPVHLHCWGLMSLAETCGPAYLGALETAIPYMAARNKLCLLGEMNWGGEECWGDAADPNFRWRALLQSGCEEGRELQRLWDKLQGEAREGGEFLGEPLSPPFSTNLEGLDDGFVSGATRGLVIEARDALRSRILTKTLQLHVPKKDRHAWAWKQRDKLSSAWLLFRPRGGEMLTNEEFSTAAAVNLCLPPPLGSSKNIKSLNFKYLIA